MVKLSWLWRDSFNIHPYYQNYSNDDNRVLSSHEASRLLVFSKGSCITKAMMNPVDKKFSWVIKGISSLQSEKCYSVPVLISDCKWRLVAFPKGNNGDYLSLYLDVAEFESLPCGWRRYVKLRLTVVNQLSPKLSVVKETEHCFDGKSTTWGFPAMLPLFKLYENNGGFLVNGQVMIVAELDVFEVIGTFDDVVAAESSDLLKKTSLGINANGTEQVENSLKPPPKKKRRLTAFRIFIFLFILSVVTELAQKK